jgi:hypothetical protein
MRLEAPSMSGNLPKEVELRTGSRIHQSNTSSNRMNQSGTVLEYSCNATRKSTVLVLECISTVQYSVLEYSTCTYNYRSCTSTGRLNRVDEWTHNKSDESMARTDERL